MTLDLTLNSPGLAALLLLGAAIALCVALYATRYPALARGRVSLLLGIRAFTLLALLFAALGPVFSCARASRAQNRLLVLVDRSGSMSVSDEAGGRSRAAAAESAAIALAGTLGDRFDVRIACFDSALDPFRRASDWRAAPHRAPGGETALGDALRAAGEHVDPDSVAAVLVLSDGAVNRGEAPDRALQGAVAVHALTVGLDRDPPTVGIAGIEAPPDVVVGRRSALGVTLRQRMEGSRRVTLRLLEGGRELARSAADVAGPAGSALLQLEFTLDEAGRHFLTVALDSVPGDPLRENKRRLLMLAARPPKRIFLLLVPTLDWDVRSLARGVEEDSSWSVVWLRPSGSADVVAPGQPPRSFAGMLENAEAVAVRFDDRTLAPARDAALRRYVERGGGALLWVSPDGELPTGSSLARTLGIAEEPWSQGSAPAIVDLAAAGRAHELSLLGGDALTASAQWRALPPVVIPASLAAGAAMDPLLVARAGPETAVALQAGRLGAGRIALLAASGVYRWGITAAGLGAGPGVESAFFGGLRRWLSLSREERPVRLEAPDITPQDRPVPVRLTLAAASPGATGRVVARPLGGGAVRDTTLAAAPEGGFAGSIALPEGIWELTGRLERAGRALGSDSLRIAVGAQGIEYESLRADPAAMERLAAATGGVAAPLRAPGPVLDRLRSPEATRTRRAEISLFQNPLLFLVIVVGAALEWALRRRYHLL